MNIRLSFALLIFSLALSAESSSYGGVNWSRSLFSTMVVDVRDGSVGTTGQTASFCKRGPLGDCIENEEEVAMESDISRRVLGGKRFISYDALKQNQIPCNRRGNSYYNCAAPGRANPYNRGCSVITHCYRFTS
ncbi:Rapid ALkalinization Factor [Corchorus olitorius]|uniref:Rapid ALkalinization Factor n=1 Tax=Corchorus olitorius TaxID=93759 RepID=A0A1R3G9P1_9ROSI|nr:Rapid ALkalinization Factor [Corchorus olitorius]